MELAPSIGDAIIGVVAYLGKNEIPEGRTSEKPKVLLGLFCASIEGVVLQHGRTHRFWIGKECAASLLDGDIGRIHAYYDNAIRWNPKSPGAFNGRGEIGRAHV